VTNPCRVLGISRAGCWMIAATLALARVWGSNVDAIPRPPEAFSNWLSNLYGAQKREDSGRMEVLYMIAVSFAVVAVCTFLVRL
jgi:hypothetical protein